MSKTSLDRIIEFGVPLDYAGTEWVARLLDRIAELESKPPPAPSDEYRRGVEDAANALNEHFGRSLLGDMLLNRVDKSIRALLAEGK